MEQHSEVQFGTLPRRKSDTTVLRASEPTPRVLDVLADLLADLHDSMDDIFRTLKSLDERTSLLSEKLAARGEAIDAGSEEVPVMPKMTLAEAKVRLASQPKYKEFGEIDKLTEEERILNHLMFTKPKTWEAMCDAKNAVEQVHKALYLTLEEVAGVIMANPIWKAKEPNGVMNGAQLSFILNCYITWRVHRSSGMPQCYARVSSHRMAVVRDACMDIARRMENRSA